MFTKLIVCIIILLAWIGFFLVLSFTLDYIQKIARRRKAREFVLDYAESQSELMRIRYRLPTALNFEDYHIFIKDRYYYVHIDMFYSFQVEDENIRLHTTNDTDIDDADISPCPYFIFARDKRELFLLTEVFVRLSKKCKCSLKIRNFPKWEL